MADLPKKTSSIWPEISDVETARKVAKQGAIAAFIIAVVTTIFSILGGVGIKLGLNFDLWELVDAAIFGVVGWRILKMSRTAAVAALSVYLAEKIFSWVNQGFKGGGLVLAVVFTLAFVNAVRATFVYRKLLARVPLEAGPLSNDPLIPK